MRRSMLALSSLVAIPAAVYACSSDDKAATPVAVADAGNEGAAPTPEAATDSAQRADTNAPSAVRCTLGARSA